MFDDFVQPAGSARIMWTSQLLLEWNSAWRSALGFSTGEEVAPTLTAHAKSSMSSNSLLYTAVER